MGSNLRINSRLWFENQWCHFQGIFISLCGFVVVFHQFQQHLHNVFIYITSWVSLHHAVLNLHWHCAELPVWPAHPHHTSLPHPCHCLHHLVFGPFGQIVRKKVMIQDDQQAGLLKKCVPFLYREKRGLGGVRRIRYEILLICSALKINEQY